MKDGKIIGEEVIVEKRPEIAIEERKTFGYEEIPNELKILMRTFKNLTASQVGVLLVPFKAKQLLNHVLSELTEEQSSMAENLLKELLFHNIDTQILEKKLDLKFEKGGADWNKKRAETFVERIGGIVNQAEILKNDMNSAVDLITDHLLEHFHIIIQDQMKLRFKTFLRMRLENKIDKGVLQKKLDASKLAGGINLNKSTAEKVTKEVEMIMLLKYST